MLHWYHKGNYNFVTYYTKQLLCYKFHVKIHKYLVSLCYIKILTIIIHANPSKALKHMRCIFLLHIPGSAIEDLSADLPEIFWKQQNCIHQTFSLYMNWIRTRCFFVINWMCPDQVCIDLGVKFDESILSRLLFLRSFTFIYIELQDLYVEGTILNVCRLVRRR